jgi:thioester reductase-like protein
MEAYKRVQSNLRAWGLWKDVHAGRFGAVAGDISKPFMGLRLDHYWRLSRDVNTVWHCAAEVNFIAPYEELEDTNVNGTVEVMRFACAIKPKQFVYASTLSVFFGVGKEIRCGRESSTAAWGTGIVTGYGQTKWVAEQLVLEFQSRGGHVLICRPGRLLGTEKFGRCPKDDLTVRMITSFIKHGQAPDLDWEIDFTPVDACARAMIDLALRQKTGIYHFFNQKTISLRELVAQLRRLGYHVRSPPYDNWKCVILKSPELRPLASLFMEPARNDGLSAFDALLDTTVFQKKVPTPCLRWRPSFRIRRFWPARCPQISCGYI